MFVDSELTRKVFQYINGDELVELAVTMGRVYAPLGREQPMADFVADWLIKNRFQVSRYQVAPERDNVVAILPGNGGGKRLIFNAHMDTELSPEENIWAMVDPDEAYPRAWVEGNKIFGRAVLNDRGSMACFMIASKAIRESGVRLRGDLIQTMVIGEVDMAPVDEFQGPRYEGIGFGTRFLLEHGVTADYAIVAETTDFSIISQECGVAYFKITTFGETVYTPRSTRSQRIENHPNAVVKMAYLIQRLEEWAREYEAENTREYLDGIVVPKVVIGAVRGGVPYRPARTSGICSAYVDVRVLPDRKITDVERELRAFVDGLGLGARVELYLSKRGFVAQGAEPLREALAVAHKTVVGSEPGSGSVDERSMWRDINLFNEWGIPAVTYGPPRRALESDAEPLKRGATDPSGKVKYFLKEDLVRTARVYALVAMQICGVEL